MIRLRTANALGAMIHLQPGNKVTDIHMDAKFKSVIHHKLSV